MADTTPTDHGDLLREVSRSVADLCANAARPPRRISVRAGDVAVDLEWPAPAVPDGPAVPSPPAGPETAAANGAPLRAVPDAATDTGTGTGTATDDLHYVCAPTVGTFYHAAGPGSPPFVNVGDLVHKGQQVAILEAMKLMMPVEADRAGRVAGLLVPNATAVEYGTRLIAIAVETAG
jgi:acetyl-CoA carboxylase biotin carboxyl carrier protein